MSEKTTPPTPGSAAGRIAGSSQPMREAQNGIARPLTTHRCISDPPRLDGFDRRMRL